MTVRNPFVRQRQEMIRNSDVRVFLLKLSITLSVSVLLRHLCGYHITFSPLNQRAKSVVGYACGSVSLVWLRVSCFAEVERRVAERRVSRRHLSRTSDNESPIATTATTKTTTTPTDRRRPTALPLRNPKPTKTQRFQEELGPPPQLP